MQNRAKPSLEHRNGSGRPTTIVIRGLNWLGDSIMSLPALMRLREAFPATRIVIVTPEKLVDLWKCHPAIDSVLPFARKESILQIAGRIRAEKAHTGILFPNSLRTALEMVLAGVPERIGYGHGGRAPFLTRVLRADPDAKRPPRRTVQEVRRMMLAADSAPRSPLPFSVHQSNHYLKLVQTLGADAAPLPPRLFVPNEEVRAVLGKFRIAPSERPSPLFGLNPDAEYGSAKRWPPDRFIAAAAEIQRRTNCRWVIFGGPTGSTLANEISAALNEQATPVSRQRAPEGFAAISNLAGETTLRELCALLKACELVLTNDTGPMHLAAAVDTPVVVPFGSTSLERTGPGLPGDTRHRLISSKAACSPCYFRTCPIDLHCMTRIDVDQIVNATLSLTDHAMLV